MLRFRFVLLLLCLVLSRLCFAIDPKTTDAVGRGTLLTEAFNGLPFFVYAAAGKLDNQFYSNFQVKQFTEQENKLLRQLLSILIQHHGSSYNLEYVTQESYRWIFDLKDSQEERTAVTDSNVRSRISLNMKRINNPATKLDFIDAIQLLLHEVSKKIPEVQQSGFDSLAAKLAEALRSSYSIFQVHSGRNIHVLTLDRPKESINSDIGLMKAFWFDRLGYEITTFDETNGNFRHIEEIRHNFANPRLIVSTSVSFDNRRTAVTRNSITGVEVDHFSDETTVVRVLADQVQRLVGGYLGPVDIGENQILQEYVIRLHKSEKPQISKRQGYAISSGVNAKLLRFEFVNYSLKGEGELPFLLQELKDVKLYLIVRTSDGLLNIPIQIKSGDLLKPARFSFERQIDQPDRSMTLIATDILVEDKSSTVLNRISVEQATRVIVPPLKELIGKFDLTKAQARTNEGWASIRNKEAKVNLGPVPFRFIFQSDTKLQEMTLYVKHSRQVYDPNKLKNKVRNNIAGQERMGVRPSAFDSTVAEDIEIEVFRIDASEMKQRFNRGHLEVEFTLPLKESSVLVHTDGPYYTTTRGFGFGALYQQVVEHKIQYGVDDEGKKEFSKIVIVNEGFQKISVEGPQLGIKINGKKGNYVTPKIWKAYQSQFMPFDSDSCESKFN